MKDMAARITESSLRVPLRTRQEQELRLFPDQISYEPMFRCRIFLSRGPTPVSPSPVDVPYALHFSLR
jgi:hypothetical protein